MTHNAKRYQFLRDRFALESINDEADFAALAHLNGDEFDAALDAAMLKAGFEVAQEVEPTGWMRDGGLLYRLGEYGSNCDEINVTMANNSRDVKARSLAASSLLRRITAPQAVNAQDQQDAQRYRHLRDAKMLDQWIWDALDHTEGDEYIRGLDAAIDAAIAKTGAPA